MVGTQGTTFSRAEGPQPAEDPNVRNAALLEQFLAALRIRNRSPHTVRAYGAAVADFLRFIAGLHAADVTHREVREWLHFFQSEGCSSQTLAQRKYAVASFFRWLQTAPTRLVPNRKVSRPLPRVLSAQDVTRLIAAAATPRDRALLEVLYASGCRVEEVCGMQVQDLDWNAGTIRVRGKGNKPRLALLGNPALDALAAHLGTRSSGPVFSQKPSGRATGTARAIKARGIRKVVDATARRAGLGAGVHPHMLRHSFATHLLESGADLRAVQELLGHASITSTQIYTHTTAAHLLATLKRCHPRWKKARR